APAERRVARERVAQSNPAWRRGERPSRAMMSILAYQAVRKAPPRGQRGHRVTRGEGTGGRTRPVADGVLRSRCLSSRRVPLAAKALFGSAFSGARPPGAPGARNAAKVGSWVEKCKANSFV